MRNATLKKGVGACEILGHSDRILSVKPLRDRSDNNSVPIWENKKGPRSRHFNNTGEPLVNIGLFRKTVFPVISDTKQYGYSQNYIIRPSWRNLQNKTTVR